MIAFAVFTLGAAWIALTPRRGWTFAVVILATLAAILFEMGYPRPHAFGFPAEITVVAIQMAPGDAIYLWSDEPVAYELPWSTETASELMLEMQRSIEAGEGGFGVELGWSYGGVGVIDDVQTREPPK